MKIYDCFSYWDEDLLLDLRLNILNEYVDYFVIVEGNKTWQNNPKKLRFNIDKFPNFKKKIIYIPVEDMPDGDDPYLRENFQRNAISRGLVSSSENDLVIISDLDEIPNPVKIEKFKRNMQYAVFRQNHYYYKINLQSTKNPYWYGSRICIKRFLKSPQWLRNLKFKKRPLWRLDKFRLNNIIQEGGWHFCNLKNAKELLYKYSNVCETNDQYAFNQKISTENLQIDKTFPNSILKNVDKYKDWIVN